MVYSCSSNRGKLREFLLAAAQAGVSMQVLPGLEDIAPPQETGDSFQAIAAAKALDYSQRSSAAVLADDSGLEVDALNGQPGIYSARYAGPQATDGDNIHRLLVALQDHVERKARFVTTVAIAYHGRLLATATAFVEGEILREPRGLFGFGYDPVFFYPPLNRSFGELPDEQKLAVSARGKAALEVLQAYKRLALHSKRA